MGAVVTRGVTTMGAEIASPDAVLPSLDDLTQENLDSAKAFWEGLVG